MGRTARKRIYIVIFTIIMCITAFIACYPKSDPRKYDSDIMHQFESDIRAFARSQIMTTVYFGMQVEFDGKTAVYHNECGQIGIESEDAKKEQTEILTPYIGEIFAEADYNYIFQTEEVEMLSWHRVKECNNVKYLIGKDEAGYLSLWKFDQFLEGSEEISYLGNLLRDVYGFATARDIGSIQVLGRNEETHFWEIKMDIKDSGKIAKMYEMMAELPYSERPEQRKEFEERFSTEHEAGYITFILKHKDGTESEWLSFNIRQGYIGQFPDAFVYIPEALSEEDALWLCDLFGVSAEIHPDL